MFIYLNDLLSSAKVMKLGWYWIVSTVRAIDWATDGLGFNSK